MPVSRRFVLQRLRFFSISCLGEIKSFRAVVRDCDHPLPTKGTGVSSSTIARIIVKGNLRFPLTSSLPTGKACLRHDFYIIGRAPPPRGVLRQVEGLWRRCAFLCNCLLSGRQKKVGRRRCVSHEKSGRTYRASKPTSRTLCGTARRNTGQTRGRSSGCDAVSLPERSGPRDPQHRIPKAQGKDAGLRRVTGGPFPHAAHAHHGSRSDQQGYGENTDA